MTRVNLNGIEEQVEERTQISLGWHIGVISKIEKLAKDDGKKKYIRIFWNLIDCQAKVKSYIGLSYMLGFLKHFLKVINQPYEGEVDIVTENWINQKCAIRIDKEDYISKDMNGKEEKKEGRKIKKYLRISDLEMEDAESFERLLPFIEEVPF